MPLIGNQLTQSTFVSDTFTATAGQTVFTPLSAHAINDAGCIVSVNGLRQHVGSFSIDATNLTLSAGVTVGDEVEVIYLGIASVETVLSADPEISTEGKYFENYTSISSNLTTAVSSRNKGLIGPITVTADWTVAGDITIF